MILACIVLHCLVMIEIRINIFQSWQFVVRRNHVNDWTNWSWQKLKQVSPKLFTDHTIQPKYFRNCSQIFFNWTNRKYLPAVIMKRLVIVSICVLVLIVKVCPATESFSVFHQSQTSSQQSSLSSLQPAENIIIDPNEAILSARENCAVFFAAFLAVKTRPDLNCCWNLAASCWFHFSTLHIKIISFYSWLETWAR